MTDTQQPTREPEFLQETKPKRVEATSGFFTPGSIVIIIGIVAMIGALAVQLARQNQTRPLPGDTAPAFAMTTFDGDDISLAGWRGQIVVVNFWGSWCAPCRDEAPDLQDIHEDFADDGVVMFGVNWLDVERRALEFMDEFGFTFPNAPDVEEIVAETYNIQGAPETFVIDRDGTVAFVYPGPVDYDTLERDLNTLLTEDNS